MVLKDKKQIPHSPHTKFYMYSFKKNFPCKRYRNSKNGLYLAQELGCVSFLWPILAIFFIPISVTGTPHVVLYTLYRAICVLYKNYRENRTNSRADNQFFSVDPKQGCNLHQWSPRVRKKSFSINPTCTSYKQNEESKRITVNFTQISGCQETDGNIPNIPCVYIDPLLTPCSNPCFPCMNIFHHQSCCQQCWCRQGWCPPPGSPHDQNSWKEGCPPHWRLRWFQP